LVACIFEKIEKLKDWLGNARVNWIIGYGMDLRGLDIFKNDVILISKKIKGGAVMMVGQNKWISKAKLVAMVPLVSYDQDPGECFSMVKIYHGFNGHVFYVYEHSDWVYCPLEDFPIDNCSDYDTYGGCQNCPNARCFIEDENGQIIPARCITYPGM